MREIKFGVVDESNKVYKPDMYNHIKEMHYHEGGVKIQKVVWAKYLGEGNWELTDILNPLLREYTGLKDKNGVEIYEGDIVKRKHKDGTLRNKIEIKWVEDKCGWNLSPKLLSVLEPFEVIGNIHENPDLLDK